MKTQFGTASALAIFAVLSAGSASAIGLDRSNQDVTAIFEAGNVVELSYGRAFPDLTGTDLLGNPYDNVGEEFTNASASLKMDLTPQLSFALIADQPFGADISYGGSPATTLLGGTSANLDSYAGTIVGRYKINDNFSVHGGLRRETLEGSIMLSGLAYGGLNGYSVDLAESTETGYLLGVAYEIPAIALRASLTYNSAMTHDFETTETLNGIPISALPVTSTGGLDGVGTTEVETPESWNLDLQTGVAADTLVFANFRYAKYSDTLVSPEFFALATGGASLTDIEDNYSAQIGVGRRFSDAFAGQVAIGFEPEKEDLVSPLDPTNGKRWLSVGGSYTLNEAITVSGGARYTWLGDANPETGTPDVQRATFTDNDAVAVGMSVAYRF